MTTVGARAARAYAPARPQDAPAPAAAGSDPADVTHRADPVRYGLAAALVLALGARQFVTVGLTVGIALALALAPHTMRARPPR